MTCDARTRVPLLVAVVALLAVLTVPAAADDSSAAEYSVAQGQDLRMSTGIPSQPNLLNAIESGQAVLVLLVDHVPAAQADWSPKPYSFVTHRFSESAGVHDITVGYKMTATGDLTPTATHRITVSGSTLDCTVSFNANGGDLGPVTPRTVDIGSVITLPASGPTREGHNFIGWSLGSSGGQILNPGTKYATSGDVTFYARWAPASETLMGDVNIDGYVDIGDLDALARLTDASALSGQARINADLNGDGMIDNMDSTLLAQEIYLGSWVCGDADLDGEVTAKDLALAIGHMGGRRLHGQPLSNIDCDKNLMITQSDIDTIRVLASASLPGDDPAEDGSGGIPWWIAAAAVLAAACIILILLRFV